MPTRERSDAGTFVETVTLEAVRDVFTQVRGPVVTSSDVAAALECTTEAARQKLTRLYDRGEIDKRKTGRTVVYWREEGSAGETTDTARGEPTPSPEETPGDTQTAAHADESGGTPPHRISRSRPPTWCEITCRVRDDPTRETAPCRSTIVSTSLQAHDCIGRSAASAHTSPSCTNPCLGSCDRGGLDGARPLHALGPIGRHQPCCDARGLRPRNRVRDRGR